MTINENCDVTKASERRRKGAYRDACPPKNTKPAALLAGPKYKAAMQQNSERELNDALRRSFTGGRVLISPGVLSLPPEDHAKVLERVRGFTAFIDANIPHHDFGSFELGGVVYCFELECFSRARDPAKEPVAAGKGSRVLTIMRADEY
jgi:hypothetical protein